MSYQRSGPDKPWPGYEVERPMRQPSVASDVMVPFLQSIITGLIVGTGITTLLWHLADAPFWGTWVIIASTSAVAAWLWRLGTVSETLWTVERIIGRDITGDDVVGKPEAHIVTVRGPGVSTLTPEERKRVEFIQFIRGIDATGDSTYRRWQHLLGRTKYEEFRDALLKTGLAEWIDESNHQRGWRLTMPGEAIITGIM